jgi:hypothetical protein
MSHLDQFTYILVDHKPVQHPNDDEWFRWYMHEPNRRVALTMFKGGDIVVSTVFTSMDLTPDHLLFETKVFRGGEGGEEWRTATWEEAEAKHAEVVRMIKQEVK